MIKISQVKELSDDAIEAAQKLGIDLEDDLSEEDLRKLLSAVQDESIEKPLALKLLNTLKPNMQKLVECAKHVVTEGEDAHKRVQENINNVIQVFKEELKRDDLSEEKREKIHERLMECLDRAESIAERFWKFLKWVLAVVIMMIGGIIAWVLGKNADVDLVDLDLPK